MSLWWVSFTLDDRCIGIVIIECDAEDVARMTMHHGVEASMRAGAAEGVMHRVQGAAVNLDERREDYIAHEGKLLTPSDIDALWPPEHHNTIGNLKKRGMN